MRRQTIPLASVVDVIKLAPLAIMDSQCVDLDSPLPTHRVWPSGEAASLQGRRRYDPPKSYIIGSNVDLTRVDPVEVARARLGGFGHRQTTPNGAQLRPTAGPPALNRRRPASILLREDGIAIRCNFAYNRRPSLRFFAPIRSAQDWRALGGMAPFV